MKDAYLLAAGVLTGLAVPTSTTTSLSFLPISESSLLFPSSPNSNQAWQKADASNPSDNSSINSPSIELAPETSPSANPEFSQPESSQTESNQTESNQPSTSKLEDTSNHSFNYPINPNPAAHNLPVSGNQLYFQRLAALRVGQIYTRISNASEEFLNKSSSRQLTYEDWKRLLALEAKAMSDGQGSNRLSVMVGDSLSLWFPKHKLPEGKLWLNQGISGDTSAGILKRLSYFDKTRPDVVYVMAGVNDLRRGFSDESILRNIKQIVKRLRKTHPQAQIVVQSILPTRLTTIPNHRIRRLNEEIAQIAQSENANYLNIHAWFVDFEGNLRPELTTDGLHLSQNGYEVWQAAIQQVETRIAASQAEQKRLKFLKQQAEATIRKSRLN